MTTADKTSKAAQFVTKLLQLTQEKRIEWRPVPSPRDDGRTAFVAEAEGKTLRIYKYGRQIEATCLEILDGSLVTYTFEDVSGLWDLYEMVAYAASSVEELMDAILERA